MFAILRCARRLSMPNRFDINDTSRRTKPLTTAEAHGRLNDILCDRLMRFDPYQVDDVSLIECAERGYWLASPTLTQMVVFHFHGIREVKSRFTYDAIDFNIGKGEEVRSLPIGSITRPNAHHYSRRPVYNILNGSHLTRSKVSRLENKAIFISHAIVCSCGLSPNRAAYRMHSLTGSQQRRATIIRRAMLNAKIEMLEEVLNYPRSPFYLGAIPDDFNYVGPIVRVHNHLCTLRHEMLAKGL